MTIHSAVEAGDVKRVQEYLDSDPASIHLRTTSGDQPLHLAAWQGKKKVLEVLLGAGADINVCGNYGRTPLYYAIENGHKSIAEILLQNGASPSIKNEGGQTPIYFAACTGDIALAKKMTKSGGQLDLNERIYLEGPETILEEIRKNPCKIDPQKEDLPGLVYDSAFAGSEELALAFAKMGVDPNAKVMRGDSVFLNAIAFRFFDLTKFLIEHGADLKSYSTNGQSVLEYCQMFWPDEHIIKLIKEKMSS